MTRRGTEPAGAAAGAEPETGPASRAPLMRPRPGWLPVAREGWPFAFIAGVPTLLLFVFVPGAWWLKALGLCATAFVVAFFRDPDRTPPTDPDAIASPADGKVIRVEKVEDTRFLNAEAVKISIFMNLFNVHVNRAPADLEVVDVIYNPGRFFSANLDKASLENEQNAVVAVGPGGRRFAFNQIAGLVARRIVCYARPGMSIARGERFGLLRFGSRLDVFLPAGSRVAVKVGEKVSAGSSTLGYWK